MTSSSTTDSAPSILVWQQHATRAAFFAAGFAVAALAPLVPFIKNRLAIDEATLGCLLLCLGSGSILAMLSAGHVISKLGCRRTISISMTVAAVALSVLGVARELYLTGFVLAVFGGAIGTLDVAMNVHAIAVEQRSRRRMMSGFHALYSIGGLSGSGTAVAALAVGVTPAATAILAGSAIVIVLVVFGKRFLGDTNQAHGSKLALPRGGVLLLGCMCFMMLLVEGAMLDWSALLLSESKQMPAAQAGIGYAVFAGAMTMTRLAGDRTAARFGARRVVCVGSTLGAAGMVWVATASGPYGAILGLALVGTSIANIVPILYSAAGTNKSMPSEHALAAAATLGYAGTLIGPAIVGFVAQRVGLPTAFMLPSVLLLIVLLVSNLVPKHAYSDALD